MTDIELVIKIPEEAYQGIVNGRWGNGLLGVLCTGVENGTPLPKGHGRLIDADAIVYEKECVYLSDGSCTTIRTPNISKTPTIIEADEESEDDKQKLQTRLEKR